MRLRRVVVIAVVAAAGLLAATWVVFAVDDRREVEHWDTEHDVYRPRGPQ